VQQLFHCFDFIQNHSVEDVNVNLQWILQVNQQLHEEDDFKSGLQTKLSAKVSPKRRKDFVEGIINANNLAWFTSISDSNASIWLDAAPKSPLFTMSSTEFTTALFRRLRLKNPRIVPDTYCTCRGGNKIRLDPYGDHLTTFCPKYGHTIATHDNIKSHVVLMSKSCGMMTRTEEVGCFKEINPDDGKRPDISFLNAPTNAGRKLITDIKVTAPTTYSVVSLTRNVASKPLHMANKAFSEKNNKYSQCASDNNLDFLPLIFESSGRIHTAADKFFQSIISHASNDDSNRFSMLKRFWYTVLSFSIQKSLNSSFLQKVEMVNGRIDHSSNHQFSHGAIQSFGHMDCRTYN
jgi:hypothetical protein